MKSRLRFALDGNNKAVIDGNIENSEDLRDEVALQFRQNFKTTGNLATLQLCNGTNNQFKITPHGGDLDECKIISESLSMFQLENLSLALEVEKNKRIGDTFIKVEEVEDNNKLHIACFYQRAKIVDEKYHKIYPGRKINIGKKLDKVEINVTLKSTSDIEHLIELLNNSIPCFEK